MTGPDEAQEMRKLKVDMEGLEMAFEDASGDVNYYLDLETGEVISITDEIRRELEDIYEELPEEDDDQGASFEAALGERNLPEWMKEAVAEADRVETGFGDRFIRVERGESRDAYGDMEGFIETVKDSRLQQRLEDAIRGKGAFRRFKDVLADYSGERERWFQFKSDRLRERIREWLAEEGVEPI